MEVKRGHADNPLEAKFMEIFGVPMETVFSEERKLDGERSERQVFMRVLYCAQENEGITESQIVELLVLWVQGEIASGGCTVVDKSFS